jgi:GTP diphosphokinase / guanosine-3',5'-bis(diphosphate) 3'-diphosphatase
MELNEFIKEILSYNPKADIELIKKAYNFAKKAHKGQKRISGEDFFEHPLNVAKILMELKAGSSTLSAALLHDVVEDTKFCTIKEIEKEFGKDVSSIVDGLTKLEKVKFETKEDYNAENIRKILLATTKDIRIMLIKLSDRLHNMRTLYSFNKEKQKRIAQETLDIYAPIAHKLGMWWIKGELEDLSLRYLEPEIYQFLKEKISEKRNEREKKTLEIIKQIEKNLDERNIKAEVTGRAKYFYSIYQKMKKKNRDFEEICDLIAIRIITKNIPDCYSALGLIHELWQPIPRRFKDYIANQKNNGYQSLHTVVKVLNENKLIEVQIRTEEMDFFAEDGIAAHWRYHGTDRDKRFDKKISWLKQILSWRVNSTNAIDFIDSLKLDLFENEIVVFTPKGEPITLEDNSTPIDFAYEVHTSLGDHCSKALVNGTLVPLNYILKPGDIVEIITTKDAQPSRQWLNYVQTTKARSKIRSFLKIYADSDAKKKAKEKYEIENIADKIEVIDKINYPIKISKCCSPKVGDKIIGLITKDKKITVHKDDCPNKYTIPNNKKIDIRWKKDEEKITILRITAVEELGILPDILNFFVKKGFTIVNINTKQAKDKNINIMLELKNININFLKESIQELRSRESIVAISIHNPNI